MRRPKSRVSSTQPLQRMTELTVSFTWTLTNPRPIQLTVAINLDSTDELFTLPQ